MIQKATREQSKRHNTRLVLRTIYHNSDISRADLARATHLTPPTISSIVAELLERNIVVETGQGISEGGKPPTLLDIAENAHHLICLDLGPEMFRGAVVNLRGDLVERARVPAAYSSDAALEQLYTLIDILAARTTVPLGLAVGTPGVIDSHAGIVRRAVNLAWSDLPLKQLLEARYVTPVHITNDSHAAALAEYIYGGERDSNNLIVIRIEHGIGAGVVLNGQIFHGDGLGAGEIGHLVVAERGDRCTCGNFGCLETIASVPALIRRAEKLSRLHTSSTLLNVGELSLETIRHSLDKGDPGARTILQEAGTSLGITLASLIVAYNVHRVVLAGSIVALGEWLVKPAEEAARQRALPALAEQTTLQLSTLGEDHVLLGCAAMILSRELGIA
jgi:predicted NBD/HSP70 family sugar kinase